MLAHTSAPVVRLSLISDQGKKRGPPRALTDSANAVLSKEGDQRVSKRMRVPISLDQREHLADSGIEVEERLREGVKIHLDEGWEQSQQNKPAKRFSHIRGRCIK